MDGSTYGLPAELLAQLTGVHIDTARRWKRRGRVPHPYTLLIHLRTSGDLGAIDPHWQGWRLVGGKLWTPEQQPLAPGDLRAIPYRSQLLAELERQLTEPHQRRLF